MRQPTLGASLLAIAVVTSNLQGWAQHAPEDRAGAVAEEMLVAPEEGGPRRWQVVAADGAEIRNAPTGDAPVVRTLSQGAILTNLGCERVAGRVWCQVRPLRSRSGGYAAADDLRPARGPDGIVPMGTDDSPIRAREGDFDATGDMPCAQIRGQPMGECAFAVARGGGGDATVAVTFSNGFTRLLFFRHGEFISGDATMSGTGRDTDWRVEDGRHFIRVDDQRYEISDTSIFGE